MCITRFTYIISCVIIGTFVVEFSIMSLTTGQLQAMSFGYLSGADLIQIGVNQLLISQFEKNNGCLQDGCTQAYAKIISKLSTRYNVVTELAKAVPLPAQGNFTIVSGVITAIGVSFPGVNYTTAPTILISGGSGTGATATATVAGGVVTAITVTNGGSGYTSTPAISFTGGLAADTRSVELVRITATLAVQFILVSLANISTQLANQFKKNENDLLQIQNGQSSLPLQVPSCPVINQSIPQLSTDSFLTLG